MSQTGGSGRTAMLRLVTGGAAVVLALTVAGCSAGGPHAEGHPEAPLTSVPEPAASAPTSAAGPAASADAPGRSTSAATDRLRLGLTEWSIETGGAALRPGRVRVEVTNAGGTGHDVVIHGEQGSWASPVLAPGQSHTMTITVVAGERLELVCTLTGHHAQGMHTTITVAADA